MSLNPEINKKGNSQIKAAKLTNKKKSQFFEKINKTHKPLANMFKS